MLCIIFASYDAIAFSEEAEKDRGHIQGTVENAETGKPVGWSTIQMTDLQIGTSAHEDGSFILKNIPIGIHDITVQRIGYESLTTSVEVVKDDTTNLSLHLQETVFRSPALQVFGRHFEEDDPTTHAEVVLSGKNLRQQLAGTISETLINEPGMAQRSMGPAPARPVLRGLGGERLLLMEDGGTSGDLSATSADHATTIDPMTAEQIELIRGPGSLIYGSNTLAGVINVIRGQIPTNMPDHMHGGVSLQSQTVNNGFAGGFNSHGPIGNQFTFRVDGSARTARDVKTPQGKLDNTAINTLNGSAGFSFITSKKMIGVSGNIYDTQYGIPGGFTGAHPNGVDIDMTRRYFKIKSHYYPVADWIRRFELDGTYAYYHHTEYEKPADQPRRVGSEFGVLTSNLKLNMHHKGLLFGNRGVLGITGEHRDYQSGGGLFTPNTIERGLAAYIYDEKNYNELELQASVRFDIRNIKPQEDVRLYTLSTQMGEDIFANERTYSNFSAAISAAYNITPGLQIGTSLMRSFRAPGIEELYSDGPHLASYSFDIGNPELGKEIGYGSEIYTRYTSNLLRIKISLFRNQAHGFIFPEKIAESAPRRGDIPLYQYRGEKVLMTGAETNFELNLIGNFVTEGTVSWVRGDIIDDHQLIPIWQFNNDYEALPEIPPFSGKLNLEYRISSFNAGISVRSASEQTRTGRFEQSTDGYSVFDAYAQYMFNSGKMLHTFSLTFENISNEEYRMHLSRVREIMPEPGRNLKLLYRMYF